MIEGKRGLKGKREGRAEKVWRGVMCFDDRGPFIFYSAEYFRDIRKDWSYGKPLKTSELIEVEIREVHSPKTGGKRK